MEEDGEGKAGSGICGEDVVEGERRFVLDAGDGREMGVCMIGWSQR